MRVTRGGLCWFAAFAVYLIILFILKTPFVLHLLHPKPDLQLRHHSLPHVHVHLIILTPHHTTPCHQSQFPLYDNLTALVHCSSHIGDDCDKYRTKDQLTFCYLQTDQKQESPWILNDRFAAKTGPARTISNIRDSAMEVITAISQTVKHQQQKPMQKVHFDIQVAVPISGNLNRSLLWNFQQDFDTYLKVFFERIMSVKTITRSYRLIPHLNIEFGTKLTQSGNYISQDAISDILYNSSRLSKETQGDDHIVTLMLLIADPSLQPLAIEGVEEISDGIFGLSFNQDGGVVIWNGFTWKEANPGIESLQYPLAALAAITRQSIGLSTPSLPNSMSSKVSIDPSKTGIEFWELDAIMWREYQILKTSAIANVESLDRILNDISQIIVDEEFKEYIEDTVSHLSRKCETFNMCFAETRAAFLKSYEALFHPSLLPALYFGPDQALAVFAPLIFPVLLRVVGMCRKTLQTKL